MLLHRFPDLHWLRQQIASNFEAAGGQGWPTVVLQVEGTSIHREQVQGTLSLFVTQRGQSQVAQAGKTLHIGSPAYALTNADSTYDLHLPRSKDGQPTQVFNCHFGAAFLAKALPYCLAPHADALLDDPFHDTAAAALSFAFHTVARRPAFDRALEQLRQAYARALPSDAREAALLAVLEQLVADHVQLRHQAQRLQTRRQSTRQELLRRLQTALDYIHAHCFEPIELDQLAQQCCLSKFHLSRAFKAVYGQAPYQYIQQLRLQAILQQLPQSHASLQTLAEAVGLENASSLSRLVYRATGQYPSAYRQ